MSAWLPRGGRAHSWTVDFGTASRPAVSRSVNTARATRGSSGSRCCSLLGRSVVAIAPDVSGSMLVRRADVERLRRHRGERLGQPPGRLRPRLVREIDLRRGEVRVAHPFLQLARVGGADRVRAERVAQVVEAQGTQPGLLTCALVAPAQRGVIEVAAGLADEDEVVGRREQLTLTEAGERLCDG